MICGARMRRVVVWAPPMAGVLKFNVDSAARGKPRPTELVGFYVTIKVWCWACFRKELGLETSNEAEDLDILKALRIFSPFHMSISGKRFLHCNFLG